jgi:membrane dipeptidase
MPIAELLREVPLVDGHNDLIIHFIDFETGDFKNPDAYDIRTQTTGQTDIPRMREGMLGGAIFTIGTADDNAPEAGLERSISLFHELASRSSGDLAVVTSPEELLAAHEAGKIAIIMGLEGGNPVEGDLGRLGWMQQRGVAEMGLVWSTNGLGTAGRNADTNEGLTELGKQVVKEMNRLGMIVDLSHASPATVRDVTAITTAPVIDTHAVAGPFAYGDERRVDASMRAIASTGGLVMPMFMPDGIDPEYKKWIDLRNAELAAVAVRVLGEEKGQYPLQYSPWPEGVAREMGVWIAANPPPVSSIADIANVYDYVRNLVGIDHIGIGSDFDGMGFHPSSWHPGLRDVSRIPALLEELRKRGWSDDDLRKLAGENFLRVWREIREKADGH